MGTQGKQKGQGVGGKRRQVSEEMNRECEIAELQAGMRALNERALGQTDIIRNKECEIVELHAGIRELNKQVQYKEKEIKTIKT